MDSCNFGRGLGESFTSLFALKRGVSSSGKSGDLLVLAIGEVRILSEP